MTSLPRKGTCGCRRGIERDNCPQCEGSGIAIDWRKFHADKKAKEQPSGFFPMDAGWPSDWSNK